MVEKRIKMIKAVYETSPEYTTAKDLERFTSSGDVERWFRDLRDETKEVFIAIHLDSKNRMVCLDVVSIGSLNASIVHPREVFKTAMLSSASALIFIHNHPSGDPSPSREDIELTRRLVDAGKILGVRVLDHIIIGDNNHYSFVTMGDM